MQRINKGVCDKEYIWNPSKCECECDKSCDTGDIQIMKTASAEKGQQINQLKNVLTILIK